MTLATDTSKSGPYNGDDVTVAFTVTFDYLAITHVDVIHTSIGGVETTWVEGTQYTITAPGTGGTVTVKTTPTDYTPATGETITISRSMPFTQLTDYVENNPFPAEAHEDAIDERTMETQQLKEQLERTLQFPISSSSVSFELPAPVASNLLGWNAAADAVINYAAIDVSTEALPAVALNYIRRNTGNTAYEERTTAQVWSDINVSATESASGIAEIATQAEVNAGTDDARYVTPLKLAATFIGPLGMGTRTGMGLSNDTDTDHDVNITAGRRRSSDDTENIIFAAEFTKQIDAAWAAGDDAGGFVELGAHTAVENSSSYPMYAVRDGANVDIIFIHSDGIDSAADSTGDTLTTAGVTAIETVTSFSGITYKYLGSVRTDGSSNIIPFFQNGNEFYLDVLIEDYSGALSAASTLFTLSTPNAVEVKANLSINGTNTTATPVYSLILYPDATNTTPTSSLFNMRHLGDASSFDDSMTDFKVLTNTSSQIRINVANDDWETFSIRTMGWCDPRGIE